jgi:hypothetical protein
MPAIGSHRLGDGMVSRRINVAVIPEADQLARKRAIVLAVADIAIESAPPKW